MWWNCYWHPDAGFFNGAMHRYRQSAILAAVAERQREPKTRLVGRLHVKKWKLIQ